MTQYVLGDALFELGERQNDAKYLLEAVNAFSEALKEFTREHTPAYWEQAQDGLALAQTLLNKRKGSLRLGLRSLFRKS